jgi:hypothetical protein
LADGIELGTGSGSPPSLEQERARRAAADTEWDNYETAFSSKTEEPNYEKT